jgi:Fe-S oxidoreductase
MAFLGYFKKSNTVYFPGCVTYFKYKEIYDLYLKIFQKLGISYKIIDKNICCGQEAFEAGYEHVSRKLARKNFEEFKENSVNTIITNMPCCYNMFKEKYSEIVPGWNLKVENIWEKVLKKLEEKPKLIKNKSFDSVCYDDNCYLGRYSKCFEEPRKILKILGYNLKELYNNKEGSLCSGGCGGLSRTNQQLADKLAKEKILQVKRINQTKLIVPSLKDYEILKKNSFEYNLKILELGEVIAIGLGIIKEKINNEYYKNIVEINKQDEKPKELEKDESMASILEEVKK